MIEKQVGWKKKGVHPATAYFLALRLQVNQELENIQEALPKMIQALKPQGRLFVFEFSFFRRSFGEAGISGSKASAK